MEFLAYVVVKLISIGGIASLVACLFIRRLGIVVSIAVGFALLDTTLLSLTRLDSTPLMSWLSAFVACCVMSLLGWVIRGRRS